MGYPYNGVLLINKKEQTTDRYVCATTWVNLENITLSDRRPSQKSKFYMCAVIWKPRIGKSTETKSRLGLSQGWRPWRNGLVINKVYNVYFWSGKNVWKFTVETVTHICEYTKNHGIVHLQWINYMMSELYLNKAV